MTFGQSFLNAFAFIFSITPPTSYPYIFTVQNEQQTMMYVGTGHSYNHADPQYAVLKSKWEDFLQKTTSKKVIVIERAEQDVEKVVDNQSDASLIKKGADTYLINQWGIKEKLPVVGADVLPSQETEMLLKEYDSDVVYYWNFARLTEMWGRTQTHDFKTWIMPHLHRFTGNTTLTFKQMKKLHSKFFKTRFNEHDHDFFLAITTSLKSKCILNELSKKAIAMRDLKIMDTIKKLWDQGKSIFVVFGATHARNQEKTLKQMLI